MQLRWGTLLALGLVLVACNRPPPNARHITIVMKKYAFEPPVVYLKKGETVVLDVYSADVQHGIEVPGMDIHEPVHKNFPASIVVTPRRKGEFPMLCSILCGPGHDDMVGKIIVE